MDFQLSCRSSLPWILAIEALGCSNLVEPSLLQDLLKKIPDKPHDFRYTMESMALKHLEIFARANPVSSSSTKVRFDPSDSCKEVLEQVLSERTSGSESSNWDLESFIKHKKSNLPKCTLMQLKDGIVTGSLSISASLKEKSGFPVGLHVENQAPAKDGNFCTPIAGGSDKDDGILMSSEFPDENLPPVNRKRKAGEIPAEQLYATCIDPAKKNEYNIICNEQDVGLEKGGKGLCDLILNNEDIDKCEQNVPKAVETVGDAEDGADISSHDDGCHDERKIIDKKKKTFLSSQRTYSRDVSGTTCMKCKKGGNLLSCTSDSCPIVIHESCLGLDKSFDAREEFYCPFCAYSRALSKCEEVEKYASLMRMNLSTCFCSGPQAESKKQSCQSSMMDGNGLEQKDAMPKTNELNQISDSEKVSNHQHRKKFECEQAGLSELLSDHISPLGRKAADSTDTIDQSFERDKQDAKGFRQESRAPLGPNEKPIAAEAVRNSHIETESCEVSETIRRVKRADVRSKKAPATGPQRFQSSDAKEISEEENEDEDEDEDNEASKYFISVKNRQKQKYPAKVKWRKKRIPWTSTEEDVLKKGVQKFCCPEGNVIPWSRILVYGQGEFKPSRTAVDLKDKWRNMCRAPKSK